MKEFIEIDSNNIILNIISLNDQDCSDESGNFNTNIGLNYLKEIFPDKKFAYYDKQSQIDDGSIDFTLVKANNNIIGGQYLAEIDKIAMTQPYPSWELDTKTAKWIPPVQFPSEPPNKGHVWVWDEDSNSWVNY